jgi:hypothetical protein
MPSIRTIGFFPRIRITKPLCAISETDLDGNVPKYGPGTLYPVKMSLASIMALYWRIRKWKFIHTLEGEPIEIDQQAFYLTPPQSEMDLICGFEFDETSKDRAIEYAMTTNANFPEGMSISVMNIFGFGQKGPHILKVGDDLYPSMDIAWEGPIRYDEETDDMDAIGCTSIETEENTKQGELTLNILGQEYQIDMYAKNQFFFYCGFIETAEFWEYDPGDGLGPIYDKTTGAQLRAFP